MQKLQCNKSTNIKLILEDIKIQITFSLNKIDLIICGSYFENLLTKFKENFIKRIKIIVPNAFVSYDVIMSLLGNEIDWNKIKASEIITSRDEKYLIFTSPFDKNQIIYQKIIVVDIQNEKILLEIDNPHELEISEIRVSNNNNFVISSSECEIKSWNLISGKLEKIILVIKIQ
ncbi:putative BTB/POZ domain-containing protein [Megavirus courdo11]|uniref:Putative BTB/POZ domain-containing protein n=1 Tax=Megavirus courdo11 TaxID=1128140 RepID=K7YFB7_9VIRU|nr:putative BTB/POZ domain-containing protein [Megavirus courdo11]